MGFHSGNPTISWGCPKKNTSWFHLYEDSMGLWKLWRLIYFNPRFTVYGIHLLKEDKRSTNSYIHCQSLLVHKKNKIICCRTFGHLPLIYSHKISRMINLPIQSVCDAYGRQAWIYDEFVMNSSLIWGHSWNSTIPATKSYFLIYCRIVSLIYSEPIFITISNRRTYPLVN